ncbi:MAG: signal peptidase II [Zetaproteobacteria bacterium]|nr:signal peptidase II [Zetaproteobacteria bacterium]
MSVSERLKWQLLLLLGLFVLDQGSKWWVEQQPVWFLYEVIDGYFNLVQAHNFGVAFSFLADWGSEWRTSVLLGVTMGIALMVILWWWRERKNMGPESWILIVILAGAAGNIFDRFYLGYVVDFIDWYVIVDGIEYHWPAFNFADAYISVAVTALLIRSFKSA